MEDHRRRARPARASAARRAILPRTASPTPTAPATRHARARDAALTFDRDDIATGERAWRPERSVPPGGTGARRAAAWASLAAIVFAVTVVFAAAPAARATRQYTRCPAAQAAGVKFSGVAQSRSTCASAARVLAAYARRPPSSDNTIEDPATVKIGRKRYRCHLTGPGYEPPTTRGLAARTRLGLA